MHSCNTAYAGLVRRAILALQNNDLYTALLLSQQLENSEPVASSVATETLSPEALASAADREYLSRQAEQSLRNGHFRAAKLYLKSMRIQDRANHRG